MKKLMKNAIVAVCVLVVLSVLLGQVNQLDYLLIQDQASSSYVYQAPISKIYLR